MTQRPRRVPADRTRLTVYTSDPGDPDVFARLRRGAVDLDAFTILRGFEGFGLGGRMHRSGLLHRRGPAPVTLIAVGEPARLAALVEDIRALLPDPLVLLEPVRVLSYRGDGGR